jgi:hypothetical protein
MEIHGFQRSFPGKTMAFPYLSVSFSKNSGFTALFVIDSSLILIYYMSSVRQIPLVGSERDFPFDYEIISNFPIHWQTYHPLYILVGGFNLPLCKMMEFVSWDDDYSQLNGKS